MEPIRYDPIGIIHSPFRDPMGTPIQPTAAEGIIGVVEVFPPFTRGLKDLDGFSHVVLLYHFHRAGAVALEVTPFLDDESHGVFATRAPSRPNAIGMSVVRLLGTEGGNLQVEDLDVLDGTPLLDIKPYVPQFDARRKTRIGWLKRRSRPIRSTRDDGRFGR
ncbi:MAG: tRNA (N6-threonylcarbamoyladenosine(37)-N6)-methyltransferase TrmO [Gemmatimonadetes bacterium]|nr:tRNA (N6-threonylcarbamoyladenosine(37)-N6)-methyltransferase TrmO [Gemmatimonadota bacterium]